MVILKVIFRVILAFLSGAIVYSIALRNFPIAIGMVVVIIILMKD